MSHVSSVRENPGSAAGTFVKPDRSNDSGIQFNKDLNVSRVRELAKTEDEIPISFRIRKAQDLIYLASLFCSFASFRELSEMPRNAFF